MITGVLLLGIIGFIGVISYQRPKLEQRVFKEIPLIDWLLILVFPLIIYVGLVLVIRNILFREKVEILDFDDFYLLACGVLFLAYTLVGNSIHFVGKVLSRYIPEDKHSIVYRVNEMFHGKLSHYLAEVSALMAVFILALLEINHPLLILLPQRSFFVLAFSGFLFGFSGAKAIFNTDNYFGNYNRPLFLLTALLSFVLIGLFKSFKLNLIYYPVNLFVLVMFLGVLIAFAFKQFFIFSRLYRKRKFRFLARVLSI